jgi:hypothetical protein
MKTTLLKLLPALALPLFAAEPNTLSEQEKKDGFVLLFDGKTLDGWRNYKKEQVNPKWTVADGAITLLSKGAGDLITTKQFTDFELRVEFKIAADGNSGIMWHVSEKFGAPYESGPEYQILDSFAKTGFQAEVAKGNMAGAFYDIIPVKAEISKPAGEWNEGVIRIVGSKITLSINGKVTADVDSTTDEFKAMLAKSKFAKWDHFNKETTGHICFQDHGNPVSFRSIRIKEIK